MLTNYFTRHMQAGLYSLGKLMRSPLASLMTCLIIGIALALPAILFVALKNAELIAGSFQQTMQITLYLKKTATEAQVLTLTRELNARHEIKTVRAISPANGLQELQKQAGFAVATGDMQDNPLPWAIVILPTEKASNPNTIENLESSLKKISLVDNIQLDILWVKRLASLITLAHRITYALAIFLGFAVLLIVNNTIRSTTQQHHKEIEVIQLIGGTDAFIRRPFLYAGMVYGLFGGILGWILVDILIFLLKSPARHLAELYGSAFSLTGMGIINVMFLLIISIMLGFVGSWFAVTKHLRQIHYLNLFIYLPASVLQNANILFQ
jgi:cell division transport system permease protein